MKELYPVLAEEVYELEREIFKTDSSYRENSYLRRTVHQAIVFVLNTALDEYDEKCRNHPEVNAIEKISQFFKINLFDGFPILFNMADGRKKMFATCFSEAVNSAYKNPFGVELLFKKQLDILRDNPEQNWYYLINFKTDYGYYYHEIRKILCDGHKPDGNTEFYTYISAMDAFGRLGFVDKGTAFENYSKAMKEWSGDNDKRRCL